MSFFAVENLGVRFGGVVAVDGVSFSVKQGEVYTIIGPNGAGKTTIFNLIGLIYPPTSGRILFEDREVTGAPHHVAQLGIARTFQNIELFEHATVLQNLLIGRHRHRTTNLFDELLFLPSVRRAEIAQREAVEQVIDLLDLAHYRDSLVAGLPYGIRKVIELGRALATEPKLVLLDEPSSGLNPDETDDMAFWIEDIQKELGITVLMVEHDMNLVSRVSDRVLALNEGKVIAEGTPGAGAVAPGGDRGVSRRRGVMTTPILQLLNVESNYGPVQALRGVSLSVTEGKIVTVLGANGAGKTTTLKTISGIIDPLKGQVKFRGQDIQGHSPDAIVRAGIVHVPEGREVFPLLSVEDNLRMGAFTRSDADGIAKDLEAVFGYFPILRERAKQEAGQLSGGQQQMLAIARALLARPALILMDEPSLGLSPKLTREIFDIVVRINRERGVTILLVEQNAHMALKIADFGYVLEVGRIVMEDTGARLAEKDDIKEFYLGMKAAGARGARRWKKKKLWR